MDNNRPRNGGGSNNNNKDSAQCNAKRQPSKDLTDVTIVSTPLPQATSTVDRRSLVQGKSRRSNLDEPTSKHRQLNFDNSNDVTRITDESSLGILQFENMSTCTNLLDEGPLTSMKNKNDLKPDNDRERELALKALKKFSEPFTDAFSKLDKENNVNSSNLPRMSSSARNRQSTNLPQNGKTNEFDKRSSSAASIVFEPNEMAARSSEYINPGEATFRPSESKDSNEKSEAFTGQNFSGISYNSNLAEMVAQFGDEEFMSGSKAGSLISADELSWRKNKFGPTPAAKNERLELSHFSGIIGSGDLTVDDERVSVGEFFQRKCGNIGHLSIASSSDRPNFGLDAKSPRRQCRPLVDQTVTSEVSYPDESQKKIADNTKDPSVLSLSNIAELLQNMDAVTPIKLVDQLMEANKKTKKNVENVNNNNACETYTLLPGNRSSLPVSANATRIKNKSEKNKTRQSYGNKLSLDSRNLSQMDNKTFEAISDQKLRNILGMKNCNDSSEVTNQIDDRLSFQSNRRKSTISSIPRAEGSPLPSLRYKLSQLPQTPKYDKSNSRTDESNLIPDAESTELDRSEPTLTKEDSTAKDYTLTSSHATSSIRDQSFDTKKVRIGKKTHELCTCLVGIPREADFELHNGTDRWIVCSLQLHQIQGEKDNIELSLPNNEILIEPDKQKSFKIGVKMPHMGKLIIVVLHIPCLDMVTKNSWFMKHLMCFVPEEPDIRVLVPSDDNTMDFQMITEDTSNSMNIKLENKNSIDVPVLLRLTQNKPELFSINDSFDESLNNQRKPVCLVLKPKMPLTINVDFRGMSLQSFGESIYQKGVYSAEATLSVSICFKENEEYLVKEIKLKGFLGSCKLDIVDTQFPLILQPKVVRLVNLKNSGSIVVTATVDVVQSRDNQTECRDFFISHNNVILNEGDKLALQITYKPENNKTDIERHAVIRIAVGNKVSFYPVIGEKVYENESYLADNSHHLNVHSRSETPQCLKSISSPTSPQSIYFNRSGTSGRHSPSSTASGGTGVTMGNIVPIRATHTSLVWGSVKIGKSDTKEFTIRNTSNSKIKLYITIKSESQCFRFFKERHSLSTTMVLSLQGMESKTLYVVFTPISAKASAGKVIFSHYSAVKESRELSGVVKVIQLFGYGGYGKIEISEAVKDTSGQIWLSLGKLNSEGILRSKISLFNNGDLTCFVKAKLVPKAFYPSMVSNWRIEPSEILLAPKQTQWVSLEYQPKKDDLPNMHQVGVMHVGTLKLTHGDEPTRLRIRRLYKKLKESELYDKIDEQADEFREVIHQISKAFPGEVFTEDLKLLKDSTNNLGDLCKGIVQSEVKLTIEIQADETMSMLQDNMEDSQMFYSLCSDRDTTSHYDGESFLPAE